MSTLGGDGEELVTADALRIRQVIERAQQQLAARGDGRIAMMQAASYDICKAFGISPALLDVALDASPEPLSVETLDAGEFYHCACGQWFAGTSIQVYKRTETDGTVTVDVSNKPAPLGVTHMYHTHRLY